MFVHTYVFRPPASTRSSPSMQTISKPAMRSAHSKRAQDLPPKSPKRGNVHKAAGYTHSSFTQVPEEDGEVRGEAAEGENPALSTLASGPALRLQHFLLSLRCVVVDSNVSSHRVERKLRAHRATATGGHAAGSAPQSLDEG